MASDSVGNPDRLKRQRLPDQIFRQLTRRITSGELAPYDALPSVSALAQQYGVSIHVAREGIAALAARGLVQVVHGRGCFVAPRERWNLVDPDLLALMSDDHALANLFEVREAFEVQMARLAALRRTDADLAALAAALEQSATDARPESQVEADYSFHCALAQATHNPLFLPLLNAIIGPLRQYWRLSQVFPDTITRTYQGHLAIYTRVQAGDAAGAAHALVEHHCAGRELCHRQLEHPTTAVNLPRKEVESSETPLAH